MSREDAIKVLEEVKSARETLEHNILHVCRKHEQHDLFNYFDPKLQVGEEENIIRIKKQVSDKIKEINNEIQTEIYTKKTPCKGNADRKPARLPLHQVNKKIIPPNTKANSRLPVKPTKSKLKKVKPKEPKKSEPPPKSSTAYDELIMQHIYGRQPHQSHRHTTKNENPSFCSPHKHVFPKKVENTMHSTVTCTEAKPVPKVIPIQPKNEYCIYLQAHNSTPFTIEHNFPNAIPLVEPSRCLSGRLPLPLPTKENMAESKSPKVARKRCQLSKGPNVAVINIKSDDVEEKSSIRKHIKSKVRDRVRNRMKLRIQPLPNVDIDTSDPFSTISSSCSSKNDTIQNSSLDAASKTNENESPYDFQDFISVHDIPKSHVSDIPKSHVSDIPKNTSQIDDRMKSEESFQQPQVSLSGCKAQQQYNYNGPAFPPQNIQAADAIGSIPLKVSQTLEQNAQDWIEQELLARLVSQMVDQQNQASIDEFADNVCIPSCSEENYSSHDWLDNIIGLEGLQLFIDAGIPVNKDLVKDLMRTVVLERLDTLFGYPKSVRKPESPIAEIQTEIKISTPLRTPSPCSNSGKEVVNETPNQTISDLTEQSIEDVVDTELSVHEEEQNYEIVTTPQLSVMEDVEKEISYELVVTPERTLVEGVEPFPMQNYDVRTPEDSVKSVEHAQVTMNDFEFSESIASPVSTITNDDTLSKEELEITPPIIVVSEASVTTFPTPAAITVSISAIKTLSFTTSPSIPSTTFTASSSVVGLSSFGEISIGEHLNPEHAVSDGSEGELGLPRGMETLKLIKDNSTIHSFPCKNKPVSQFFPDLFPKHLFPPTQQSHSLEKHTYTKNDALSEGEIGSTAWQQLKSVGEVSIIDADNTNVDSEELTDYTLEEISKALNDENDPMIKILNKISAPMRRNFSQKSEGEVISQQPNKDGANEIPDLSSGENISDGSLSLGMLNQESDLTSSIQEDSNLTPLSIPQRRVITVKPVNDSGGKPEHVLKSEGEILNTDNSQLEICKSEGELLNLELDSCEVLNRELDLGESLNHEPNLFNNSFSTKTNNDKVVMVLRLPEVDDDDQNLTYDDILLSPDDISTISGGEF